MASASFSLSRGAFIDTLSVGAQAVTEGTSAPGAGDLEVRVNIAAGWTKTEVENAMDTIYRFLTNANNSTSIPL
jgi:hypothetical protein